MNTAGHKAFLTSQRCFELRKMGRVIAADSMKLMCSNTGKYKPACQISKADSAVQAMKYILLKGFGKEGKT